MSKTVKINGISYADVPRVKIPLNSDPSQFAEFYDISNATATAGDMLAGKTAYGPQGSTAESSKGLITGTIATKTASDLTASGKTVTVPAGYYATQATKDVTSGTATTPATTITANPTVTFSTTGANAGKIVATVSGSSSITPTVSAGYVATGTSGTVSVSGTTTLSASTLDPNLKAENIKAGTSILGVSGSSTVVDTAIGTTASATADDILSGKSAYVNGSLVEGAITSKTSTDVTVSGATVTIPAGYYASGVTKSVESGSATTPTTSLSITPTFGVSTTTGIVTVTGTTSQSVTPTVSAGYVTTGTSGTVSSAIATGSSANQYQLPTQAAQTITPGTTDKTIAAGKWLTGVQTIKGDANLVAGNIKQGTSIFGVSGTLSLVSVVQDGTTKVLTIS